MSADDLGNVACEELRDSEEFDPARLEAERNLADMVYLQRTNPKEYARIIAERERREDARRDREWYVASKRNSESGAKKAGETPKPQDWQKYERIISAECLSHNPNDRLIREKLAELRDKGCYVEKYSRMSARDRRKYFFRLRDDIKAHTRETRR